MMLFLIPARAGSKRLPGKNKRLFCGLPLWQWSVMTARRMAKPGDDIIVSSDDPEIFKSEFGEYRTANFCRDESTTQSLVNCYFLRGYRVICLLQPTSPTRSDFIVRSLMGANDTVRSVTDGEPNGQCYVYHQGRPIVFDIPTARGHDIDTLEQFEEAEKAMLERFH